MSKPPIGTGHAKAWFRSGFKEAAQALVALPQGTIRPTEEMGLLGNPTPQEVMDAKEKFSERLDRHAARDVSERQSPSLER